MSGLPSDYRFEPDAARLDREVMHRFLANETYWSRGLPRELMDRAIDNSLCIGVFHQDEQVGFARAVTDYTHFAYVADVHVLPSHRGQGIARAMIGWLHEHPEMRTLRRWLLVTRDAAGLYAKLGYGAPDDIEQFMQRRPGGIW